MSGIVGAESKSTVKIGLDLAGNCAITVVGVNVSGSVSNGLSVAYEAEFGSENTNTGIGFVYLVPRDNVSFLTVYGLLKPRLTDKNYLVGQLGYSLLFFDTTDLNSVMRGITATFTGDIYYGLGLGFLLDNNSQIEILYSMTKGKGTFNFPGCYSVPFTIPFTIDYSKITLSYGFKL